MRVTVTRKKSGGRTLFEYVGDGWSHECEFRPAHLKSVMKRFNTAIEATIKAPQKRVKFSAIAQDFRQLVLGDGDLCGTQGLPLDLDLNLDHKCAELPWELLCDDGVPLGVSRHIGIEVRRTGKRPDWAPMPEGFRPIAAIFADPDACGHDHIEQMREMLEVGYGSGNVVVRADPDLAAHNLVDTLRDPNCTAAYVIAHGRRVGGDSYIKFPNDQVTPEHFTSHTFPGRPLIFLNCCWTGNGLASALWRCGASMVVAPTSKVAPEHAINTASIFFRSIFGTTAGKAMEYAKRDSYRRYSAGEAHISWLLYRLFGDPSTSPATRAWGGDGNPRHPAFALDPGASIGDTNARVCSVHATPPQDLATLEAVADVRGALAELRATHPSDLTPLAAHVVAKAVWAHRAEPEAHPGVAFLCAYLEVVGVRLAWTEIERRCAELLRDKLTIMHDDCTHRFEPFFSQVLAEARARTNGRVDETILFDAVCRICGWTALL